MYTRKVKPIKLINPYYKLEKLRKAEKDRLLEHKKENIPGYFIPIFKVIAGHFKIKLDYIFLKTRKREVIKAKHFAAFYFCVYKNISPRQVGNMLSLMAMDRTSVMHARESTRDQLSKDEEFQSLMSKLLVFNKVVTSLSMKPTHVSQH